MPKIVHLDIPTVEKLLFQQYNIEVFLDLKFRVGKEKIRFTRNLRWMMQPYALASSVGWWMYSGSRVHHNEDTDEMKLLRMPYTAWLGCHDKFASVRVTFVKLLSRCSLWVDAGRIKMPIRDEIIREHLRSMIAYSQIRRIGVYGSTLKVHPPIVESPVGDVFMGSVLPDQQSPHEITGRPLGMHQPMLQPSMFTVTPPTNPASSRRASGRGLRVHKVQHKPTEE